jgi:pantothenate kinase
MHVVTNWPALIRKATDLLRVDERVLLGITGPPGAGKSTLSRELKIALGDSVQIVEMDGFHLSRERLRELGRLDRMGAIDTFDAEGFVDLVRKVRDSNGTTIYAPRFHRDSGTSVENSIAIEASVQLVIVEGNYLLMPTLPWVELRSLLDEVWYCEREESSRIEGLIARRKKYGQSELEAREWALGSDLRNAEQIQETKSQADTIVKLDLRKIRTMEFKESVD